MLNELNNSLTLIIQQTTVNATNLSLIVLLLWVIFILNQLTGQRLLILGIIPRRIDGLPGILFAPLLHANFNHLFFNTIPLVVLSNFILIQGLSYYLHITLLITLISGLLTWCFAKPGIHLGASAVITGYWAVLICHIYQQGTLTAIILGMICFYYFAGIFLGIFPGRKGISWEGHLFGLIAGFITAYLSNG